MRIAITLSLALMCVVAPSPTRAQEPATAEASYAAAVAEVGACYARIEELRAEYQSADDTRREEIDQTLVALLSETKQKVDTMISAALEAFRAAPLQNEEVTQTLLAVAEFSVVGQGPRGGGDQYEAALPIIEALVDAGHERDELPVWGALAAIAANEFELADKFVAVARERGSLTAEPAKDDFSQETFQSALRYIKDLARYRQRWEKEKAIRDAEAQADDLPRVRLTTTKGEIVIEMFENEAPTAVANFITLVKGGFYDGVVFHRVLPHFMAQGGDPTGTGRGGPGHTIRCECERPDARMHFRGSLSMAHAGKDTGGSQFFLTFVPTDFLDGRHTVFGRVVEGIEVIGELQKIDPERPLPGVEPDKIVSAEVLRDRGHEYEFEKLPGR